MVRYTLQFWAIQGGAVWSHSIQTGKDQFDSYAELNHGTVVVFYQQGVLWLVRQILIGRFVKDYHLKLNNGSKLGSDLIENYSRLQMFEKFWIQAQIRT